MNASISLRWSTRLAACWLRFAWLGLLIVPADLRGAQDCPAPRVIPRDELLEAMRQHGDYNIVATPNWGRFQTEVFLNLMHTALARDSQGGVILIQAEDWYQAYVQVAELTPATIHQGTRLARDVGQAMQLDFRRGGVIQHLRSHLPVKLAANARIFWPDTGKSRSKFSYRDTLTEPRLQVTTHRLITYRLLEFDGMIWYDDIKGVYGRPTSGFLGFLFSVFGEGALVESRLAVADHDNILVVRARSKKIFAKTVTAIVRPEGRGESGVLPNRPDLADLEQRLRQPIDVAYLPYRC